MSQRCHTCNQTARHPAVKRPASDRIQTGSYQQWTPPSGPQTGVVHTFTGGPRRIRNSEAPGIEASSSPLRVFQSFFAEIITLLVAETNRYYHDHLDILDQGPPPNLT